ncbi:MAG TPA: hypothetical protein DFR83_09895 [Deltaproteobacteria bacterium]|nr:hypothetical protein [Deltaproteobacteria bacterium]
MLPTFVRAVLLPTRSPVSLDLLQDALETAVVPEGEWVLLRRLPPVRPGWFLGDEALLCRWIPEPSDGPVHPPITVVIDAPDRKLPSLGSEDADLTAAYALGAFGPGAAPGGLVRASQASPEWPEAAAVAGAHEGLIRVRLSYGLGAGGTAAPSGRVRDVELNLLTALVTPLLELSEVLGWFHAPGERLVSRQAVRRALKHAREDGRLPIELWTHQRAWKLADADEWVLHDTVGMPSMGGRDIELAIRADQLPPVDAAVFLRNLSLYTLDEGDPFKSGHTAESPVGRLRARVLARGFAAPVRRVVRWSPIGGRGLPAVLQA